MRQRGGAPALLAAFTLLFALLMQLGYALKVTVPDPPVMWPAAGLLLVALWILPLRLWPLVLAIEYVVEMATASLWIRSPFSFGLASLYPLANIAGAAVAAGLARWLIRGLVLLRAREVLWFIVVTALGAAVSASIAVPVHLSALGSQLDAVRGLVVWQIWAASQWAGIITVAPLIASWLSPLRHQHVELRLRSRLEPAVLLALLLAASFYVQFGSRELHSLLQLPTTIVLLMVAAVMRLPPRWVVTLFSITALAIAVLASNTGAGPSGMTIAGVGQLQIFIVTLGLFSFVLSVTLAERGITARRLRESDDRYRSFVALSNEALWRIELARPMPLALPAAEQVGWMRAEACVAESSRSYELIDARAAGEHGTLPWDPSLSWVAAFEAQLPHAAKQGFDLDGMRFEVDLRGRRHVFVASFTGVVKDGALLRLWGVARDITELAELNASLLRERERLKSYARQIVTAEEKARRATAVDLHDGIGQSLAGMAMTLDVARQSSSPEVRLLIEEVRSRLFEVQERTRSMISDLSPPGLYELGLKAALQWLVVYVRGHDRLQVEMDAELREDAVPLEMRVLVFKLVRELLRNVVKHAGVTTARLQVRGDETALQVEVSDQGRGFEWQLDMFGTRTGGFGLWSIADRVGEVGGEFNVETGPGRGTAIQIRVPLRQSGRSEDRRLRAAVGRGA